MIAANLEKPLIRATARACALWRFRVKRAAEHASLRVRKTRQNNNLDPVTIPATALEKRGQLVKCVKNLKPHEKERCDHQIIANVHAGFETNASCGPRPIGGRP